MTTSPAAHPPVPPALPGEEGAGTELSWRPLLRVLTAVVGLLVVVGPVLGAFDLAFPDRGGPVRGVLTIAARTMGLGGENTVPAWFASSTLLALAAAFALVALCQRLAGGRALPYGIFAVVALALSVDEAAVIHEQLGRITVQFVDRETVVSYTWLIPGAVIVLAVGAGLLRLARGVPRSLRTRLVVAGSVYVLGALVFEGLTGLVDASLDPTGAACAAVEGCRVVQGPAYRALNTVEEGLELAGALLALRAALLCLRLRRTAGGMGVALAPAGH